MKYFQHILLSLFSIVLITGSQNNFAQGLRPGGRSLSPSPEAAALNKLIDNPVSYYTGTPSVSVPVYNIQLNELSLPVSLTYNASGLKVSEHASWVGAGWTLNAAGMVNRTIKGLPDEFAQGELKGYFFQPSLIDPSGYYIEDHLFDCADTDNGEPRNLDLTLGGAWDFEPDLYHFSAGGYSGKFLFDKNRNPVQLNASDVDIASHPFSATPSGDYYPTLNDYQWQIDTPDGATWYFEKSDKHTTDTGCGIGSSTSENGITERQNAWHLVKVTKGADEILFEYVTEVLEYTDVYSASAQYKVLSINELGMPGQTPTPPPMYCTTSNTIISQRLSKIVTNNGTEISFEVDDTAEGIRDDLTGSRALKEIVVETNGQIVNHLRLNQDYFGNGKKLKLESVDQLATDNSGESIRLYDFTYFENQPFPDMNSKSQDMWGFYNGANNVSFLPQYKDENYHVNAKTDVDKSPNLDYARIGTLKKITLPTGGSQEFDYELHDFSHDDYTNTYYIESQVPAGSLSNPTRHEVEFTVEKQGSVTFVEFADSQRNIDAGYYLNKKINGVYTADFTMERRPGYFQSIGEHEFFGNRLVMEPGEYKLITESEGDPYHIRLVLDQQEAVDFEKVGGLRIREIKTYDPFSELTNHQLFEYSKEENGETRSSGVVFTMPDYGAYYTINVAYDAALDGYLGDNPDEKDDITNITYTKTERKVEEKDDGTVKTTFTIGQVTEFFDMNSAPDISNQCRNNTINVYMNLNSSPQIPGAYSSGSHVGYSEVKVYNVLTDNLLTTPKSGDPEQPTNVSYGDRIRKNGYTAYYFINDPSDQSYEYPYVPGEDLSYKNGKLLKSEVYQRSGDDFILKQRQTNFYGQKNKIDQDIVYSLIAKRMIYRMCYGCADTDVADRIYSYITRWHYLDSTSTEVFDGGTLLTGVKNFYETATPYNHYMSTGSQTEDSKGNVITTSIDRVQSNPELIREQEVFVNGVKTAGELLTYTGTLPKTYDVWNRDLNVYQRELEYNYDSNKKLIESKQFVSTASPVEGVVLYGYNGARVIASVSNITKEEFDIILSGVGVDRAWFNDLSNESDFRTRLLQIQSALADHQLMQANLYGGPYGPTESIDVHGKSTYFSYDGFGRLKMIKDRDNHILQQYEYQYGNQ